MRYKRLWIRDKLPNNSSFEAYETTVAVVKPTNKLIWKDFKNCIEVVDAKALEIACSLLKQTIQLVREHGTVDMQYEINSFLAEIENG